MWNSNSLIELMGSRFKDCRIIIVSNREPYIHRHHNGGIECISPASGMVTALGPVLKACGGTWIAHGSGDADKSAVGSDDSIMVPEDNPKYKLRRVWLTKEEEKGYYYGLSNESLWPLCHITFTRPKFDPNHWDIYQKVNSLFADTVIEELDDRPTFVFIQDYHLALLPKMLKDRNPNLIVGQFWHIPWPNRETFRAFPWKEKLLEGLLGNDLLGFHIRHHCLNFLETVDRGIEAKVDHEKFEIIRNSKTTVVRPFPISIDFEQHEMEANSSCVKNYIHKFFEKFELEGQFLGLGIDRIDYTKGIPERLMAINFFLEKHPEYTERFTFIQIGVPSRSHIDSYRNLEDQIDNLVEEINWRWQKESWKPIIFLKGHFSQFELMAFHRLSKFCLVTSLHDGLNLVAKEFVASRSDNDGVLILSQFTGAARELTAALLINPFSIEEISDAIFDALTMPESERKKRMLKLREAVFQNNIYRWAGKFFSALLKFETQELEASP